MDFNNLKLCTAVASFKINCCLIQIKHFLINLKLLCFLVLLSVYLFSGSQLTMPIIELNYFWIIVRKKLLGVYMHTHNSKSRMQVLLFTCDFNFQWQKLKDHNETPYSQFLKIYNSSFGSNAPSFFPQARKRICFYITIQKLNNLTDNNSIFYQRYRFNSINSISSNLQVLWGCW